MEKKHSDSDEDRPPLPLVPPPSTTPPPTPAAPSSHQSNSPSLFRKEKNKKSSQVGQNKVYCPLILKKSEPSALNRSRSVIDVSKTSPSDSFLDILKSRNSSHQNDNRNNEFDLDLDNFSRELISIFEDLDAKIITHQRSTGDICMALPPKGLKSKDSADIAQVTKKKVDSENYIVTASNQNYRALDASLNSSKSSDLVINFDSPQKSLGPSDCNEFSVKERAIPSPSKKFENREVSTAYHKVSNISQAKINRSLSFSTYSETIGQLPKTIVNQSYQFQSPYKNKEKESNINFMLYNHHHNYQSSADNNNRNAGKIDDISSCESTHHILQPQKCQKNGFQNFCSRLKQRSGPGRNIYRQYMKQVIDKAPKLDGYESDASSVSDFGEGNSSFSEKCSTPRSLCPSPNKEIKLEMKLSDETPVNIYGTVRNSLKQEVRGKGNTLKNIRNIFNISGKQEPALPVSPSSYITPEYDRNLSFSKTSSNNGNIAENGLKTGRTEVSRFSTNPLNNDISLKRRTCFQSLLNIFNAPEIHQTSWKANIEKGKLKSDVAFEARKNTSRLNSAEHSKSIGEGYGSLNSSKRFVSCLEINLGK